MNTHKQKVKMAKKMVSAKERRKSYRGKGLFDTKSWRRRKEQVLKNEVKRMKIHA